MMQENDSLKKLYQVTKRNNKQGCFISPSLCQELRTLQLPADSTQKLKYLIKEREVLIQLISDYQIELKVIIGKQV